MVSNLGCDLPYVPHVRLAWFGLAGTGFGFEALYPMPNLAIVSGLAKKVQKLVDYHKNGPTPNSN